MNDLHQYQRDVLSQLGDESYLALEMGLGKTRIMIEHLDSKPGRILVVAPLMTALHTWPSELEKWSDQPHYTVIHGLKKSAALALSDDVKWLIINFEGIKWLMTQKHYKPFDTIIVDEGTRIKSHKAQITKLLVKLGSKVKRRYVLSGTPTPNEIHELWGQFRFLDGGTTLYKTWTEFMQNYGFQYDRYWNPFLPAIYKDMVRDRIMEACKPKMLSLKAKDVLDMPECTTIDVDMTLAPEAWNQYKTYIKAKVIDDVPKSGAVLTNILRQFLSGFMYENGVAVDIGYANTRLAMTQELVEQLNRPVMIMANFRAEYDMLMGIFPKAKLVTGTVSEQAKSEAINAWNSRNCNILICNPDSIGHGVNCQYGGATIIWYSLPWSYELYAQTNARLWRQGQEEKVFIYRILFAGTIDKAVVRALERKEDLNHTVMEYVRIHFGDNDDELLGLTANGTD